MGPPHRSDGNRARRAEPHRLDVASMGPPQTSGGYSGTRPTAARPSRGFNGAAARKRRKSSRPCSVKSTTWSSFNETAAN